MGYFSLKESAGVMAREKKKEVSNVLDAELLQQWVSSSFVKVLESQLPIAVNTVSRLRRVHPDKSPKELVGIVDKSYMGLVTGSGASAGLASVVPNGPVQGPVAVVDLAAFLEASVMYVLTVSEIYGVDIEDFERRRFLVMTALLGNSGTTTVTQALGKKTVPYWSHKIINAILMKAINQANKVLGPRFITKYGAKQGVLVLGKQLPLALGAVVGAGGNATFGYFVTRSTKRLLGTAPQDWTNSPTKSVEALDGDIASAHPPEDPEAE